MMPSTTIPSASPSIIGFVSKIDATVVVTSDIAADEVDVFVSTLATYYGVDESAVDESVMYNVEGTMMLSIPEGVDEVALAEAIQFSIAEDLGNFPGVWVLM